MSGCAHCDPVDETTERDGSIVVGLVGNPNTGKSSIFNHLTGAKQHVGNWPGKTVARAHGSFIHRNQKFQLVDLPGTYSLNAASPEEMIARDFLVRDRPDVVVVVADASNIERNLYLVVQVLEVGLPTVVALNMVDVADSRGSSVSASELSDRLGVPVVPTIARKGEGLSELQNQIRAQVGAHIAP